MLALLILACDGAVDGCEAHPPDTCPTDNGECLVVDGSQLEPPGVKDEQTCWDVVSSSSVACTSWKVCDWKTFFATNPDDGSCWYFPTGCVPPDWAPCEESVTVCD